MLAIFISVISNLLLSLESSVDRRKKPETRWAIPLEMNVVPVSASAIALGVIGYPAAQGLFSKPFLETLANGGIFVAGLLLIFYAVWLMSYYLGKP